jgi:putative DNA methylase
MPTNPRWFSPPAFGLTEFSDLFTNRQSVALTTFSDLVQEAHAKVTKDAEAAELPITDATAYADAIATYVGLCASKMAVFHCSLSRWRPDADKTAPAFGRQAIAMVWDYAECAPFAGAGGDWLGVIDGAVKTLLKLSRAEQGIAMQADSQSRSYPTDMTISTDPPYYDNIGYADLSDFFYVWLRRSLGPIHGEVTSTMLTPKAEELVATPYRFGGSTTKAREHFESGLAETFRAIRASQNGSYPVTTWYAFKQSESDEAGFVSTGWETMLTGLIDAGFAITATWPMRSEMGSRLVAAGTNALASSIVLACRPREIEAPTVMRAGGVRRSVARGTAAGAAGSAAGRDRAGRSAAGGDRSGDGDLLPVRPGARSRWLIYAGSHGIGADQPGPR